MKAIYPGAEDVKKRNSKTKHPLRKMRNHRFAKKSSPPSVTMSLKGGRVMGILIKLHHKDYLELLEERVAKEAKAT